MNHQLLYNLLNENMRHSFLILKQVLKILQNVHALETHFLIVVFVSNFIDLKVM